MLVIFCTSVQKILHWQSMWIHTNTQSLDLIIAIHSQSGTSFMMIISIDNEERQKLPSLSMLILPDWEGIAFVKSKDCIDVLTINLLKIYSWSKVFFFKLTPNTTLAVVLAFTSLYVQKLNFKKIMFSRAANSHALSVRLTHFNPFHLNLTLSRIYIYGNISHNFFFLFFFLSEICDVLCACYVKMAAKIFEVVPTPLFFSRIYGNISHIFFFLVRGLWCTMCLLCENGCQNFWRKKKSDGVPPPPPPPAHQLFWDLHDIYRLRADGPRISHAEPSSWQPCVLVLKLYTTQFDQHLCHPCNIFLSLHLFYVTFSQNT